MVAGTDRPRLVVPACLLAGWLCVVLSAGPLRGEDPVAPPADVAADPAAATELESRIAALIQQLGAPEFATRERAQVELERLRLDAFDALNEAQSHDDIEIAMSARYLVRRMQVTWVSDDDSQEVKQLLQGYGEQPENERRNLIDQLALLGSEQALRPLCHIVRYEASEKLSKCTALVVMSMVVPEDAAARSRLGATLQTRMGTSRRTAATWLRAYAALLNKDPAATAQWQELVEQEQTRLVESSDQTSREITRDLLKWFADQLTHQNQPEQALAVMRKMTSLLNSTPQEVLEAVDWFRDRASWPIVVEIATQFPETFKRSPLLLYRLAETYRQLGDQPKAEETAQQALRTTPDEWEKHLEMAGFLQHDGLFDSAEREYRHVAQAMESEPLQAIRARYYLSEMLHSLRKDQAAGEVLKEIVTSMEADQELSKLVTTELGREVDSTKSRMQFFFAEHEAQQGNTARQRELLMQGYQYDPTDADLLIAMYRVPQADEAWMRETRERIKGAADDFRRQIKELQDQVNNSQPGEEQALNSYQLALMNNQLAWLLANTDGDADEAIRCSLQSLAMPQLENRSGFLDTLGRCYYAKGDYVNAVKFQTLAVAQEPHSPTMVAQLQLLQQALQQQEAARTPGGDPPRIP